MSRTPSTASSDYTTADQLGIAQAAPHWPDQSAPQQLHLDFAVDDLDEAEALVLKLGATKPEFQLAGLHGPGRSPLLSDQKPGYTLSVEHRLLPALEDEQLAGLVLGPVAERGQRCLDSGEARVDGLLAHVFEDRDGTQL